LATGGFSNVLENGDLKLTPLTFRRTIRRMAKKAAEKARAGSFLPAVGLQTNAGAQGVTRLATKLKPFAKVTLNRIFEGNILLCKQLVR
jgi:hypothetical protein